MDKEKVVLITGATGGVGKTVASTFAETGVRIALTARSEEALQKLGRALSLPEERLLIKTADLSDEDQVKNLMDAIAGAWGGADILVNIAGGFRGGSTLSEVSHEDWQMTIDMNLTSAFLINRAVLPWMVKKGWGRIINFSSRAAENPGPKQAAYNAAKAGVSALTASIAAEYRRFGISANAILPSIIDTKDNRSQMPDSDFSRWVKPAELAALILFLCGEEGGSINGAAIPVYGKI